MLVSIGAAIARLGAEIRDASIFADDVGVGTHCLIAQHSRDSIKSEEKMILMIKAQLELRDGFRQRMQTNPLSDKTLKGLAATFVEAGCATSFEETLGMLRHGEEVYEFWVSENESVPPGIMCALSDAYASYLWRTSRSSSGELDDCIFGDDLWTVLSVLSLYNSLTGEYAEYSAYADMIQLDADVSDEELEVARGWQLWLSRGPAHAVAAKILSDHPNDGYGLSREAVIGMIEASVGMGAVVKGVVPAAPQSPPKHTLQEITLDENFPLRRSNEARPIFPMMAENVVVDDHVTWATEAMRTGCDLVLCHWGIDKVSWKAIRPETLYNFGALILLPEGAEINEGFRHKINSPCHDVQVRYYPAAE